MSEQPFNFVDDHVMAGYQRGLAGGCEWPLEAYPYGMLAYAAWRVGYRLGQEHKQKQEQELCRRAGRMAMIRWSLSKKKPLSTIWIV